MDYIDRMVQEKELLDAKIQGAEEGLNKLPLDDVEKRHLRAQLLHMHWYSNILKKRIDYANSKGV